MAVTVTQEQTLQVSTNATSYNMTAFTPAANKMLIVVFSLAGTTGTPPDPPVTSTGNTGTWWGYYSNNTTLPGGITGVYMQNANLTSNTSTVVTITTNAGDGATGINAVVYSLAWETASPVFFNNPKYEWGNYDNDLADAPSATLSTYTNVQTPVVDSQYLRRPSLNSWGGSFQLMHGTADVSSGFTLTPPTGWSSTTLAHSAPTVTLYVAYAVSATSAQMQDNVSFGSTPSSTVRLEQTYRWWSVENYNYDRFHSYQGAYNTGGSYGQFGNGLGDGVND